MDTNTNQLCRGVTNAPRVYQPTWIQHGKLTVDQAGRVLTIATIASPDFKYSLDQSASCFPFFFLPWFWLVCCNATDPSLATGCVLIRFVISLKYCCLGWSYMTYSHGNGCYAFHDLLQYNRSQPINGMYFMRVGKYDLLYTTVWLVRKTKYT